MEVVEELVVALREDAPVLRLKMVDALREPKRLLRHEGRGSVELSSQEGRRC